MKKPTFKEIVAGSVALMCAVALIVIYFFPSKGNPEVTGGIVVCFIASFGEAKAYLFGTSSGRQAKDDASKETTSSLIDALKESSPTKNA